MADTLTQNQVLFAVATGLIPSLLWLWFWLRIDKGHHEPFGLLLLCFVIGGVAVLFATWLERGAAQLISNKLTQVAVWAGIEEVLKFLVYFLVAYNNPFDEDAVDPSMYMITVALGFAALENIFYVLNPSGSFNITAGLLTGGARFFGATLLHTIASSLVGIAIALTPRAVRFVGILFGLAGATFLHATFNFFILKNDTVSSLQVYGYLWVAAIIGHLILEKLRRIPKVAAS